MWGCFPPNFVSRQREDVEANRLTLDALSAAISGFEAASAAQESLLPEPFCELLKQVTTNLKSSYGNYWAASVQRSPGWPDQRERAQMGDDAYIRFSNNRTGHRPRVLAYYANSA